MAVRGRLDNIRLGLVAVRCLGPHRKDQLRTGQTHEDLHHTGGSHSSLDESRPAPAHCQDQLLSRFLIANWANRYRLGPKLDLAVRLDLAVQLDLDSQVALVAKVLQGIRRLETGPDY